MLHRGLPLSLPVPGLSGAAGFGKYRPRDIRSHPRGADGGGAQAPGRPGRPAPWLWGAEAAGQERWSWGPEEWMGGGELDLQGERNLAVAVLVSRHHYLILRGLASSRAE